MSLEVLREALVTHQVAHRAALLGAERQGINLLLLLIQGLDAGSQVIGHKSVELVGRRQFAVDDNEWAIEVSRAVDLELVGEGIAWESIAVALQKQDVQADVIALRVFYFTVVFERYLFSKNAEERLLVRGNK